MSCLGDVQDRLPMITQSDDDNRLDSYRCASQRQTMFCSGDDLVPA